MGDDNAAADIIGNIAKHHLLHRHRSPPVLGKTDDLTIGLGPGGIPGIKHQQNGLENSEAPVPVPYHRSLNNPRNKPTTHAALPI